MNRQIAAQSGFPVHTLGTVSEFLDYRRRPVKESERVPGLYPYYGANGQQGTIDQYLFDEPLILVAEDGGHFNNPSRGIAYQISGKSWVNNHAHVLRPKTGVDIGFLCRVLENYDVTPFVNGTTRSKLTKAGANEILIPLPPLAEQKRIAAILDKADQLRNKRRQAIALLDSLTQSIFLEMFGDLRINSHNYPVVTVGDVADCIVPGRDKPKSFTGTVPWITTAELNHLNYTCAINAKQWLSRDEIIEVRARVIPSGSVILTCVGDLGVTSIASGPMVINQQLHSFQCSSQIQPEFLMHALTYSKEYMFSRATKTTLPYMNKTVCNSIPIPLPPIEKQQFFRSIFREIQNRNEALKSARSYDESLFSSLQHRAFSGKL